ncbi:MAG TPA: YfhO family protein [Chloroflexia bacterium]|nr:YfhO family protein [Chloroflexia bacterium]
MIPAAAARPRLGPELAGLLALLGFVLALAAPILAGGVPVAADTLALWGPQAIGAHPPVHNSALADSALQGWPWQVFIRQSLAHGEWPLWDPDLFAGYPFLGNDQHQLYYPIAWLLWLLPLPAAMQTNVLLHLWLAGAGMYLLGRVLGASRSGSLLGALAFTASGQAYTALDILNILDIYVWLPWVLAATEIAWRRRSWPWTAGGALLFGVQALAGHLPWFLYSSMFLGLWLALRVLALVRDRWRRAPGDPPAVFWGQVARAAAILAGGPAVAAIHLLPFAELAGLSSRVVAAGLAPGPDQIDRTGRLLARQVQVLVPQFLGTSVGSIGQPLVFNNCWYVGLAPLALAALALLVRRERRVWALAALGLAAFAVAANLPFFNRLHQLPSLQAQLPARAAYVFIVCMAALSGLGFDAALALARAQPRRAAGVLGLLAVGGAGLAYLVVDAHRLAVSTPALYQLQVDALRQAGLIAGALGVWAGAVLVLRGDRRWWGHAALAGGLLGLTVVDLLTYAPGYNTYVRPEALQLRAPAADVMRADPGLWRMMAPDAPGAMFVPNTARLYGLHDVQGYDSLHLARYEAFWAAADPQVGTGAYFNVMIRPQNVVPAQADLLGVKYVTTWAPLSPLPAKLAPMYEGMGAVYTNQRALPRAFVVDRAIVLPAAAIPARVAQPGFDPRQAVLLEQPPPAGFAAPAGPAGAPGRATITRYQNLSVDVTAQLDRPGWLVLADVNYPGWQVTVDGQAAPLYTAYYILRAVPLAAGRHQVRFYFQPGSVLLGAAITLGALLAAAGVIGGSYLRRRKPSRT